MKNLVLFFLPAQIKTWIQALGIALIIRTVAKPIGFDEVPVEIFTYFSFIALGLFGSYHLQMNISWVKSLPISKLKIYLSSVILLLTNLCLLGTSATLFFVFSYHSRIRLPKKLPESGFFEDVSQALHSASGRMTLALIFTLFLLMTYSPFVFSQLRLSQIQTQRYSRKKHWGTLALIAVVIYLIIESKSFFVTGSFILAGCFSFFLNAIRRDFSLYPSSYRKLGGVMAGLAITLISLIYSTAIRGNHSDDATQILESEQFLGVLTPKIDDRKLVSYFSRIEKANVLKSFISAHPDVLKYTDLPKWIEGASVQKLDILGEEIPLSLSNETLLTSLLKRYDDLHTGERMNMYIKFQDITLLHRPIALLLASENLHEYGFGLIVCRKNLDEACTLPIQRRLVTLNDSKDLDDELIFESLRTLSIIHGKWVGYEHYADLKRGIQHRQLAMAKLDCDEILKRDIDYLINVEAAPMNHCIRKAALKTQQAGSKTESYQWISGNFHWNKNHPLKKLLKI